VRDERGAPRLERLEGQIADAVERPLARAEDHGHDVEPQLVDQARREDLANRRRAARDPDVAVAGRLARPVERRLDPNRRRSGTSSRPASRAARAGGG
jgi:hypothetical protein